jgi:FkbM family methyltransferase
MNVNVALKACRDGFLIFNRLDFYVGRSIDLYGEYSSGEAALFRKLVKPGMTVIDAGANIGAHTILLSRLVGERGRVIAIEPQRIVFQMLCGNCALNGLENVFAFQAFVADSAGSTSVAEADFRHTGNFGGYALAEMSADDASDAVATVRTLRLDELLLPACGLIKIDVEGMELAVLEGATQTILAHRPALLVENDRAENHQALCAYLRERLRYRLYWQVSRLFNAENFFNNPVNVFGGAASYNLLCLPEESDLGTDLPAVEMATSWQEQTEALR